MKVKHITMSTGKICVFPFNHSLDNIFDCNRNVDGSSSSCIESGYIKISFDDNYAELHVRSQ